MAGYEIGMGTGTLGTDIWSGALILEGKKEELIPGGKGVAATFGFCSCH